MTFTVSIRYLGPTVEDGKLWEVRFGDVLVTTAGSYSAARTALSSHEEKERAKLDQLDSQIPEPRPSPQDEYDRGRGDELKAPSKPFTVSIEYLGPGVENGKLWRVRFGDDLVTTVGSYSAARTALSAHEKKEQAKLNQLDSQSFGTQSLGTQSTPVDESDDGGVVTLIPPG